MAHLVLVLTLLVSLALWRGLRPASRPPVVKGRPGAVAATFAAVVLRTPLVVAEVDRILGVVYLKDIVKGGLSDRFARFRAMGIRTVVNLRSRHGEARAVEAAGDVDTMLLDKTGTITEGSPSVVDVVAAGETTPALDASRATALFPPERVAWRVCHGRR